MCQEKQPQKDIKLLNIKVKDLKCKLEDLNFVDFIPYFDISILTETWKADPSKINIEASQVQSKHKNANHNKTWTETEWKLRRFLFVSLKKNLQTIFTNIELISQ